MAGQTMRERLLGRVDRILDVADSFAEIDGFAIVDALLDELREPTAAMVEAAAEEIWPRDPGDVWRAMLGEASETDQTR